MTSSRKSIFLVFLLVASLGLTACSKKVDQDQLAEKIYEESQEIEEEYIDKLMKEFNDLKLSSNIRDKIVFMEKHIREVGEENADEILFSIEDQLLAEGNKYLLELEKLDKDQELRRDLGQLDSQKLDLFQDEVLREKLEEITREGYGILLSGRRPEIQVNYENFLGYTEYSSQGAGSYFKLESDKHTKPLLVGGELGLAYGDLVDRLEDLENFLTNNKDSRRYDRILADYRASLLVYLGGTEAQPISDEGGKIRPDLMKSYREAIKSKEDITSYIIRQYIDYLNNKEAIVDGDNPIKVLSLVNEALNYMENSLGEVKK